METLPNSREVVTHVLPTTCVGRLCPAIEPLVVVVFTVRSSTPRRVLTSKVNTGIDTQSNLLKLPSSFRKGISCEKLTSDGFINSLSLLSLPYSQTGHF